MPADDTLLTPAAIPPDAPAPGEDHPLDSPPAHPEPEQHPPRRRRRRRLRTVLAVAGVAATGALLWSLLAAFLLSSGIERIPAAEVPGLDPAGAGPVNYLLVGTDSRDDLPAELGEFFGDFSGERADVIMVMHVVDGRLQLLSLPRDLRVHIPGRGSDRINAAYAYGGPDLLITTVKQATNLPIHHYLEVRFAEFAGVVDALGGVDISFPSAARDARSGLAVDAGSETLNGTQAVAYVRSRSYEELDNGTWVAREQGDIPRTARQQQVVDRLLAGATHPGRFATLPFVTRSLGRSLRADSGLSTRTLLGLGWAVARAGETETATLPSRNAPSGGVSYLAAVEPDATVMLQRFAGGERLGSTG